MTTPERKQELALFPEYGLTKHEIERMALWEEFHPGEGMVGLMSPERAKEKLVNLGFREADFESIVRDKIGSHDNRTWAIIALGDIARLENVIYSNLRLVDYYENDCLPVSNQTGFGPTMRAPEMHTQALKDAYFQYMGEEL